MKILLLIGIGGFIGTLMRYVCVRSVDHLFSGFPWGTLVVNVFGAFLAGFFFVLCRTKFQHYEEYFPILFMGILGAFTTFSTFALESTRYFLDGQYIKFIGNILLQNTSCIFAAGGGIWLSQTLFK